jgi:hypothetical protein
MRPLGSFSQRKSSGYNILNLLRRLSLSLVALDPHVAVFEVVSVSRRGLLGSSGGSRRSRARLEVQGVQGPSWLLLERRSRAEHVREKMIERGDHQHWHWVLHPWRGRSSRVKIREKLIMRVSRY